MNAFPRLKERRKQQAGTLSGGEHNAGYRQSSDEQTKLLMLDEPSMGLAPILVDQIFSIVKELNDTGTTITSCGTNCPNGTVNCRRGYFLKLVRSIHQPLRKPYLMMIQYVRLILVADLQIQQ
jgi:branched-chain amino acid transport system ATP-binding protein